MLGAAGVLLLVGFLKATASDLTGTVFVKMESGDVKRAADTEVLLVTMHPAFDAVLEKLIAEYGQALADIKAEYERGKANATSYSSVRLLRLAQQLREQSINNLQAKYQKTAASELLKLGQVMQGLTDIDGRYEFQAVQPGRYYLFADYRVFNRSVVWMVPVEIQAEKQKLDLSNRNAGWPKREP
jgi:hypothetical protein